MAPDLKSSDAGYLDMPKKSCKVLPLNEKGKVLNLVKKKEKKFYVGIYSKNESSIHEIVKKEKKFMLILLSHIKL